MNIAVSTFVIILFLLPGLVFRRCYYTEEFSKQYFKSTFFGIFSSSFVPSLVLHLLGLYLISIVTTYTLDLSVLAKLFTNTLDESCIENIKLNANQIVIYNLFILATSALLGISTKRIVRYNKLDRTYKIFKFKNTWHYILTGELFDFPRINLPLYKDKVADIELVFCNVLMRLNHTSYLYDGILVDYELNRTNGLTRIALTNAQYRIIEHNTSTSIFKTYSKPRPIKGHVMVFEYAKIENINFSYYTVKYNTSNSSFSLEMVN